MRGPTAYIIPGFDERTESAGYHAIASAFQKRGIAPVVVPIGWKQRTVTSYVNKLMDLIKPASHTCIFGFSMGAMVALIAAGHVRTDQLILGSLSPYFKEDLSHLSREDKKTLGKRRIKDFRNYSFPSLAARVQCRTVILAGSEESKIVLKRCEIAKNKIGNAVLTIIPNATHTIQSTAYRDAIHKLISV